MQCKERKKRAATKVVDLYTQADRARKLAAASGSTLVAELFEMHARLCEQNAEARQRRKGVKNVPG